MRLFEFEAREVVKRAGIPVTDFGFTTDPAEARQIAERIGGPTVIKSQVLTGGRMKAGGVKFAEIPEEVLFARKVIEAIPDGRGVHMIDGKMQDDATWKQCQVMVALAEMLADRDPELAEAYGLEGRFPAEAGRELAAASPRPVAG